ncbi:MAG: HEAT repeat domain-containing protein [Prochlorococcaceae cyanobacterium]
MSPTFLGGVAALLLFVYWSLRRRSPVLLRSTDATAIAALNRAQIALVRGDAAPRSADGALALPELPLAAVATALIRPADVRQRAQLLATLRRQLDGDAPLRLEAMRAASQWGHAAALPVLRRGLRDVDPAVVQEAARGMERFRCCPRIQAGTSRTPVPLPRNVSRTR